MKEYETPEIEVIEFGQEEVMEENEESITLPENQLPIG